MAGTNYREAPSRPGLIHALAERHRRELLAMEREAASEMVRAYGGVWSRLQDDLDRLLAEYGKELAQGVASPSWLWQRERLTSLQRQVEKELSRFAGQAGDLISGRELAAVQAAQTHNLEMAQALGVAAVWDRLPAEAVTELVGFTRAGSPLRDLLDQLGPAASQAVRDGLIQGVALGQNPRKIAAQLRDALGGNLTRALRISRTEVLRSYREATRRGYEANSDIVAGWRWLAAKQGRTCAACLAMDGTVHKLSEVLDDHPCGRCTSVPVLRGEEGSPAPWETGSEWFARQGEETQRQVLGNAGYEAYKAEAVTLNDFVGQRSSPAWGTMRYARSLTEIVGKDETKKWITTALQKKHEAPDQIFANAVNKLNPSDVLAVGEINVDIIRQWTLSVVGNTEVVLIGERRDHILKSHPDMRAFLGKLQEAVLDPDEVHRDDKDKYMAIFYRQIDAKHFIRVAVLIQPEAGGRKHSIISARQAYMRDVERQRDRRVWTK